MSFFTVGNLLTLGIVALALILFRKSDRTNRSLEKLRKYADHLKEDLTEFAAQKEAAVLDYGVQLDVHQKQAKELMNRLQLSEEAMAAKIAAVADLNEKIKTYDSTLGELVRMTVRVQENLTRIKEESPFVEGVGKRVSEAKEKLSSIEKGFADLELRFERENAESLEHTSASLVAVMKSTVSDLQVTAETIERRVEDHRDEINRIEQERAANLARDMALIEKTLQDAVEAAALRTDKMEEAALVKLREQAMERLQGLKTLVEDKLRDYQETGKAQLTDIQDAVRNIKEDWKTDHAEMEREQLAHKEAWGAMLSQTDTVVKELEGRLVALDGQTANAAARMKEQLSKAVEEEWQKAVGELELQIRDNREAWETILNRANTDFQGIDATVKELEGRLVTLDGQTTDAVALMTERLSQTIKEESEKVLLAADAKLEDYREAQAREFERLGALSKEVWKAGHAKIEQEQRTHKEEWRKDVEELGIQIRDNREAWGTILNRANTEVQGIDTAVKELEGRLKALDGQTTDAIAQMKEHLSRIIEAEGQKALESTDAKLEEYREAQAREFERLRTLSDDTALLDEELRRYMAETENRVRQDFARFEEEFADTRSTASAEFAAGLDVLRGDISGMEKELSRLKEQSYDTVSGKLKVFEDEFTMDLFRRREEFDARLGKWKDGLAAELAELAETSREERRKIESAFGEDLKRHFADEDARLVSELEHLKAETGALEEGIRNQMTRADESLDALKTQLDSNLAEARDTAESAVKAEIGRFSLSMAETLKQQEREIDEDLKQIAAQVEFRNGEFSGLLDESRRTIEEWQNKFTGQMRDMDASVEEYRRKIRELGAENEDRLAAIRSTIENLRKETEAQRTDAFAHTDEQAKLLDSAIKDADRRIKEFVAQTKLFDQADELKAALERKIEDLRGDLDGLDQRRTEAADLEAKFVRIKRLEEDVDAKMVKFQSEQRRIEIMEADFNRLLQTSQSVKEKLSEVTASDDTLQAVQVQIRRLEDSLTDAEERYQRIEKKNETLEVTNAGIDDNFKALRESESMVQRIRGEMQRLLDRQEELRASVEKLAAENAKATEAAEQVSSLDGLLNTIETRMDKLQTVRESLARAETRYKELNDNAQEQFKLFTALFKDEPSKLKGAPPINQRESVIKLKQQGWAVDQIARTLKISVGEVELILEMGSKI
ncbi:hypothetical protein AGMMS49940_07760 [Spirochaetia bacterium]|nr:hypothetical protein AGMMS49940_07760 [Spirochaetia bacterium]